MTAELPRSFFERDVLTVAHDLVGKVLARKLPDGTVLRLRITETEAYKGTEDTACHAHKGKTARTEVMWRHAGTVYVYLIYGIHCLLNIVTGEEDQPQAVLIRACGGYEGPGKLTKYLKIDLALNRTEIPGNELWIEDDGTRPKVVTGRRIGIDYANQTDREKEWRFIQK